MIPQHLPPEMDRLFDEIEELLIHAEVLKTRSARLTMRSEECTYRSRRLQRTCRDAIVDAGRYLASPPAPLHRP
jgi:hypothetical protein